LHLLSFQSAWIGVRTSTSNPITAAECRTEAAATAGMGTAAHMTCKRAVAHDMQEGSSSTPVPSLLSSFAPTFPLPASVRLPRPLLSPLYQCHKCYIYV